MREEDFKLFRAFRPGLVQFEIGVQSTNPDTIRAIRRTMNLAVLSENIKKVRDGHNIHEQGFLLRTLRAFEIRLTMSTQ